MPSLSPLYFTPPLTHTHSIYLSLSSTFVSAAAAAAAAGFCSPPQGWVALLRRLRQGAYDGRRARGAERRAREGSSSNVYEALFSPSLSALSPRR